MSDNSGNVEFTINRSIFNTAYLITLEECQICNLNKEEYNFKDLLFENLSIESSIENERSGNENSG